MSEEKKQPRRPLRAGEALCRHDCGTIVDLNDKGDGAAENCGMCCKDAVDERTARVAPIHEAAQKNTLEQEEARAQARAAKEASQQ